MDRRFAPYVILGPLALSLALLPAAARGAPQPSHGTGRVAPGRAAPGRAAPGRAAPGRAAPDARGMPSASRAAARRAAARRAAARALHSRARPRSGSRKRPRVAVLILQTGMRSSELADNLTEVLLVSLSTRGQFQVVGKEVVKTQLGGVEKRVLECVGNRTCVGNVATSLALDYLIVGTLGKLESTWMYNLYFIDAASGGERKRVHRRVKGGLEKLTRSLDRSLAELLKPRVKPGVLLVRGNPSGAKVHIDDQFAGTVPLRRTGLKPGTLRVRVEADGYFPGLRSVTIRAGETTTLDLRLLKVPPRKATWKLYLAWSSLGLSVVAGASAIATGVLSGRRRGVTQAELLADLARRTRLARVANAMIGVSAVAGVTWAALLIFAHKGFFSGGREAQGPRVSFGAAPTRGGAYVSGGVKW